MPGAACDTHAMVDLEIETCPNCGAPLHLDAEGLCTFCRAKVARAGPSFADVPAPARAILHVSEALASEAVVSRFVEQQGLAASVPALMDDVAGAGRRVVTDGLVLDERRIDFGVYTPDEMWVFNLAADLVAMLAALPNLAKTKRAAVRDLLITVDAALGTHSARSTIGNAHEGPADLRPLRETIPHRKLIRP